MKKVIMMLAAVAMAVCAQAATVTWTVLDPNDTAKGVYALSFSQTSDDSESEWNTNYSLLFTDPSWLVRDTWEAHLDFLQKRAVETFTSNNEGAFSFSQPDVSEQLAPYYSYLLILVTRDSADLTPGGEYDVYVADMTTTKTLSLDSATPYATGKFGSDAIPEPTSGFLLLLGMAGLALKRKVA